MTQRFVVEWEKDGEIGILQKGDIFITFSSLEEGKERVKEYNSKNPKYRHFLCEVVRVNEYSLEGEEE